ncbi:hypothetical protein ScalyP_jg4856 [Parmales sp. scaly parma]|nr:hypothetical protein ScalyP_jg4856 [Parmales sp. scaly parma]
MGQPPSGSLFPQSLGRRSAVAVRPPPDSSQSEEENENEISIGENRRVPQALLREEPSTNSTDTPPSNELVKATKEIEKQKKEITRLTSENVKTMKQIVKMQQKTSGSDGRTLRSKTYRWCWYSAPCSSRPEEILDSPRY